jgi:hypothetical protein
MYVEFGRGTVSAPSLCGLSELADRFDGAVIVTAQGTSIDLPIDGPCVLRTPEPEVELVELYETIKNLEPAPVAA